MAAPLVVCATRDSHLTSRTASEYRGLTIRAQSRHQPLRVGECPSRASSGIAISARTPSSRIGRSRSILSTSSIVFASTASRSKVGGDLLGEGLREERRVAHLEPQTDDGPALGRHILEHLGRAARAPPPRSAPARRGSAGTSSRGRVRAPPTGCRPRPRRRRRDRAGRTRGPSAVRTRRPWRPRRPTANSATVRMPRPASRLEIFVPTPHRSIVGRAPITSSQLSAVSRKTPRGLPKPVATFARTSVSPMPTLQCSAVRSSTALCSVARVRLRVVGGDADERLIPAEHLHDGAGLGAQRRPSPRRTPRCTPRGRPGGSPHPAPSARRSAAASPSPTPNSRASYDAVETTARSVGSPRPPTITGLPGELRMPQHLDRRDELVEVDVQHPLATSSLIRIVCVLGARNATRSRTNPNGTDMIQHTVVFRLAHDEGSAAESAFLDTARATLTAIPGVVELRREPPGEPEERPPAPVLDGVRRRGRLRGVQRPSRARALRRRTLGARGRRLPGVRLHRPCSSRSEGSRGAPLRARVPQDRRWVWNRSATASETDRMPAVKISPWNASAVNAAPNR